MSRLHEISSSARPFSGELLLLSEFAHRINNEFASAISAISVTAARSASDEVKAILAAVIDRLHNYAQVHQALEIPEHSTSIDGAAYLRELCAAISRSKLDCKGIELVLVGRPLWMDSERCWRLGMIVSELITNAARHAFRKRGGVIRVELSTSRSVVECRVTDNGMADTDDTAILDLRKNNVIVLEEQLRQTRDRFIADLVTGTDVAQAESSLASARSDYFSAQANLQTSIATYRQIIGVEPTRLEPARTIESLLPRSLGSAIELAMAEHPEIQASLHAVDAAALQVKLGSKASWPRRSIWLGMFSKIIIFPACRGNVFSTGRSQPSSRCGFIKGARCMHVCARPRKRSVRPS
jgi:two-component sensor histidine kinase